ncbi:MAG TPA: WhiB family transcriptional regulator [Pseudonocardiaceae bacterium]|jgi:WhiB family redox-sensing transcriptional regulator
MNGTDALNPGEGIERLAESLDAVAGVPDEVLLELVTRDGSCMELYGLGQQEPAWSGDDLTDREFAARICAGCPVRRECLELQLRTSGAATVGVWGSLPAEAVRELFTVWRYRRRQTDETDPDGSVGGERV